MKKLADGYPATSFQRWLAKRNACHEGRTAVGAQTYEQFWESTKRTDWLHWLCDRINDRAHPSDGGGESDHAWNDIRANLCAAVEGPRGGRRKASTFRKRVKRLPLNATSKQVIAAWSITVVGAK